MVGAFVPRKEVTLAGCDLEALIRITQQRMATLANTPPLNEAEPTDDTPPEPPPPPKRRIRRTTKAEPVAGAMIQDSLGALFADLEPPV